ncbi:zinc finger protein 808 [Manduca sexta]|uniref:C2H2-type domain-containing protein n=1 Tax=Manduca sexta TaxID=7130 RepID=A0A921ZW06_MANSE|nr:zinc finger protein 808 [Manduca sexta]KAG6463937.1 hypothetical protein O3G_MSEX014166 [Manduca sexta]
MDLNYVDPLEGSSYSMNDTDVKTEEDDEEQYNTMDLLQLARCVQTVQEPIEFNSTDAMLDPKTNQMVCLHCLDEFDSNLLSDHMINAHNYRRIAFKCHICQNVFQERRFLLVHRQQCRPPQKHHKRKTFVQIMKEVENSFTENDNLLESVACPICVMEMPKYCLKEHLLTEHRKPEVTLTCEVCKRNFKSKLTLREHIKLVHEAVEDSEQCELCGQKFRSLKYLANHKRNVHPTGDKIHKCNVCGKQFKSRLCLHQHCKHVHPPPSACVTCPHCSKTFKSKINLHQHLKVSHGLKNRPN